MMDLASIAAVVFWVGGLILFYIYCGYGLVLWLLRCLTRPASSPTGFADGQWPDVTVLLCVHNEERNVRTRLDNLMEQQYPGTLEVLVVSDGSTDATESIIASYSGTAPVRLLTCSRLGKSGAQNMAIGHARGEIVILTDAEATFAPDFVKEMVCAFADPAVGCVTGQLRVRERSGAIAESQGFYWGYELRLRRLESDLGILAVASGQAMGFRRSLYTEIPPYVGDDCFIPLAVVAQGSRVVHCQAAEAYDYMESEAGREFASRQRMTMRNWTGTWLFPTLLSPIQSPGYAFALWSHKLLRWLGGGLILLMMPAAGVMIAGAAQVWAGAAFLAFMAVGLAGHFYRGEPPRIVGIVYSFLLANLAFLLGVTKAVFGSRITAYVAGSVKVG